MKKFITFVIAGGMLTFSACGPSKEELAKIEQAKQDSIAAVEAKAAEEAAAIEKAKQDSIDAVTTAIEKARQDSIATAEAAAAAKPKAKAKNIEEKKKEEAKKATSGRG